MPTQAQVIEETNLLEIAPETVKAYIRANPGVITDDPDLLCALIPAARSDDGAVLDVQRIAIDHLKSQSKELIRQRDRAFDTLRQNSVTGRITENAILAVLEARNFENMVRVVTKILPSMIEVDHIVLCMEEFDRAAATMAMIQEIGIHIVPECTVDAALGEGGNSLLKSKTKGIKTLFGEVADDVQSYALLRLAISPDAPPGLLAIGSSLPNTFHPSLGSDMLEFLSRVIERQIGSWLGLPRE